MTAAVPKPGNTRHESLEFHKSLITSRFSAFVKFAQFVATVENQDGLILNLRPHSVAENIAAKIPASTVRRETAAPT